jgi:hypothetical protein
VTAEYTSRFAEFAPKGKCPPVQVTLGQIGIKPGTEDWDKISVFANGYDGNDFMVKRFCQVCKRANADRPSIVIYSFSKHHASVQSKIIDAISKGV